MLQAWSCQPRQPQMFEICGKLGPQMSKFALYVWELTTLEIEIYKPLVCINMGSNDKDLLLFYLYSVEVLFIVSAKVELFQVYKLQSNFVGHCSFRGPRWPNTGQHGWPLKYCPWWWPYAVLCIKSYMLMYQRKCTCIPCIVVFSGLERIFFNMQGQLFYTRWQKLYLARLYYSATNYM